MEHLPILLPHCWDFSFKNLNFLLFWFIGLEWEDSSFYFLDVYVQHPEFIHRATRLPLKIRVKSRSNMINISSFALQTQRAQTLDCVTAGQWLTSHHQQAMKAKPQSWGQTLQLETSFTGFSVNAFYVIFANSHRLSCSISVFVRPKPLHKLLVFYTRTFLEVLRRDCSAACLGCSLCYTIKVPSKPMLGQKHLCYPWRHHLEMYSVIWEFWNYCASLTDHVTEKLQTNIALVSTHSTIPVALSHSKGGWKLKLMPPKMP